MSLSCGTGTKGAIGTSVLTISGYLRTLNKSCRILHLLTGNIVGKEHHQTGTYLPALPSQQVLSSTWKKLSAKRIHNEVYKYIHY